MSDNEAEMPSIASQDEAFTGDEEETWSCKNKKRCS